MQALSQPHSLYVLLSVQHRSTVLQTFLHVVVDTLDVAVVACGVVSSVVVPSDVVPSDVVPSDVVSSVVVVVVGSSLVVVGTLSVVVHLVVVVRGVMGVTGGGGVVGGGVTGSLEQDNMSHFSLFASYWLWNSCLTSQNSSPVVLLRSFIPFTHSYTRASNKVREFFTITEKSPFLVFSWSIAPTFTFKTLIRRRS